MNSTEVNSTEVAEVIMELGHTEIAKKGSREWVFTINNPTEEDADNLRKLATRYICWAPELAPITGTPHLQGYVVFKDAKTRHAVSRIIPRAYLAPRSPKSSPLNCRNYIFGPYSKDGKEKPFNAAAVEVGTLPHQGERTDLLEFHAAIKAGKRGRDLSTDFLAIRAKYPRLEQLLVNEEDEQRAYQQFRTGIKPNIHVRWGEAGVGKTRYIYDTYDVEDIYVISVGDGNNKSIWWDGYKGQKVILIDDFEGEFGWKYLLRLLDRYPFRMQNKGSYCWRLATEIFITSNDKPEHWYTDKKIAPLMRRIDSVTEVLE